MDLLTYKGFIVFAALISMLVLERLLPAATVSENFARLFKNFSLAGSNAVMSALIVIPVADFFSQWSLQWRPESLLLDLLLLDLWIYVWHRLNHVVPFFWRFHEVHHLDETLDASSALRFHFGEVLLSSMARVGIIVILGVPVLHVVIFEMVLAMATLFHHSNIKLPAWFEAPLSLVFVTPSIHWVHHHAVRADTDSNYATVLSVWDRLFRSRSSTQRNVDMKIGVEGLADVPIVPLILRPFFKR